MGVSRASLHDKKNEQRCPMSNFPRLPASLVAVLGLPCFWWSSTLCPASIFKRQKCLELIFSFVFPLRSKKQICSSAFTSGIQLNNCVPFRWINLPAPSIALQFPLCLSYVVFLIMPQELCSHLSLVWTLSLDCRTQDNQSKELSWCWRPFSWCSQQDLLAAYSQATQPWANQHGVLLPSPLPKGNAKWAIKIYRKILNLLCSN